MSYTMSKEIICDPVEAAGPMPSTISSHQHVFDNLIGRMKRKLKSKNPYLLIFFNSAIYYLDFCKKMIDYLSIFTSKLSENVIFALRAEENQMLDAIRLLESLVQPFEHDWVVIPLNIRTQCTRANDALSIVAADMYVISRVVILTGKPR
jgi:hypothetical protein